LRDKWLASLPTERINRLRYDWRYWARPEQILPEGEWQKWLYLGGRGTGKTRAGAQAVLEKVAQGIKHIAMVGPTGADVRDVMTFGPSGVFTVAPPWCRPDPFLHRGRHLVWPNGAIATLFSAEEPERFRGPQHEFIWADECCAWRYAREAWELMMLGLRLGDNPQIIVTTTPKPVDILIGTGENGRMLGLLNDPGCVVSRGSSYDNRANLAETFFSQIIRQYEGTRLGRQELEAEIIEDLGGLWSRAMIEECRVRSARDLDFSRIVVSIDPAATSGEESDETGIIVAGKLPSGHGYVLGDFSGRYKPIEWAQRAIGAYREFSADRIVAEVNNGGEMVEATIRMVDPDIPFTALRASRGKVIRAEPVAALYEQRRIHHVGAFPVLEDQMAAFTSDYDRKAAGYSPDRVDALVWAISELLVEQVPYEGLLSHYAAEAASARESLR
jgi:phage terminase large subunit-like protein